MSWALKSTPALQQAHSWPLAKRGRKNGAVGEQVVVLWATSSCRWDLPSRAHPHPFLTQAWLNNHLGLCPPCPGSRQHQKPPYREKNPGELLVPCFGESGMWWSISWIFCVCEQDGSTEILGWLVSEKKQGGWKAHDGPNGVWQDHGLGPEPQPQPGHGSGRAGTEFKN